MADKTVEEYLHAWGLETYIDKFKDQAIDAKTLLLLTDENIKDLVPTIGHRALLTAQIKALKEVVNSPVTTIPPIEDVPLASTSCSQNNIISEEDTFAQFVKESSISIFTLEDNLDVPPSNDLHNHLQSINEGRALLKEFEDKGILNNTARRKLCGILINRELQGNPDQIITSKRFYDLAYQITTVFNHENSAVYFTPFVCFGPTQKTAAKGKLLDTYRQRRKEFAKSGLIQTRKRSSSRSSSCSSAPASPSLLISTRVEAALDKLPNPSDACNVEDYLLWLKNTCDPWMTVQLYWELTRKVRFQQYADSRMTIADFFNEYRALGQSGGLYLLLDDFKNLYPDSENKLFENWPLHRDKIINLAKKRNEPVLQNILSCINDGSDENLLNTVAFMAISYLMNTSTIRKGKTPKLWRPSKIESQQGFILHVTSSSDLEASITLRKEKMVSLGLTVQPFIVLIGPNLKEIHTRYIVVNNVKYSPTNDIRYNSTSVIHAVDSCFKILFALNAEYPVESAHIWTFIQRAMYDIKTKYDKVYTTVNAFMTDLGISL